MTAHYLLAPVLAAFSDLYPEIEIEMSNLGDGGSKRGPSVGVWAATTSAAIQATCARGAVSLTGDTPT